MFQADIDAAALYIRDCLSAQLPAEAFQWVEEQLKRFPADNWGRSFHLAFSGVPRRAGRAPLQVDEDTLQRAKTIRPGWHPESWQSDQAARILFLLSLPREHPEDYKQRIHQLFDTADMGELTAIYAALPLLAFPETHTKLAAEGIRTNMTVVFDAVALLNPYPAEYLDDNAWNQMFLKAVFIGRPLYKIMGIKDRANAALTRIVSDYAHERWAASREVSPEIWYPVAPFLDEQLLEDMRRLFSNLDPLQQAAAALTCSQSEYPGAKQLLTQQPFWQKRILLEGWTWERLGKDWEAKTEA